MIPPRPPDSATGSEKRVFRALAALDAGQDAVALTSLNLSKHEYQRWGEIDFVLAMPRGLIVIEVKGGQVRCEDGLWRIESRYAKSIEKEISPIAQASRAYFSLLKNHLLPNLGTALVHAAPSGFCVIYAGMARREGSALVGGPESPAQLIAFSEELATDETLAAFLAGVLKYWREQDNRNYRQWSGDEVAKLVRYLRPSFDRVPPLSLALAATRQEQYELTSDQYRFLDFASRVDRLVCTGGAGAGKTFMAVECLRREQDRRPLLITGTQLLAEYLRASNVPNPRQVLSYAELQALGSDAPKCGVLIVDEGQQLTNRLAMDRLFSLVDGGMGSGRWRWFTDPNYQVSSGSNFDSECQQLLDRSGVVAPLEDNCRNTPQVIKAAHYMTGISLGAARMKGNGPDVVYGKSADSDGLVREAAAQVKRWLDDPEIAPGKIVFLSPLPFEESSIPAIAKLAGIQVEPWHAGWEEDKRYPRSAGAAEIERFRGLESPFVVICDIDERSADVDRSLYIAMTRANFGLFVGCSEAVRVAAAIRFASSKRSQPGEGR